MARYRDMKVGQEKTEACGIMELSLVFAELSIAEQRAKVLVGAVNLPKQMISWLFCLGLSVYFTESACLPSLLGQMCACFLCSAIHPHF